MLISNLISNNDIFKNRILPFNHLNCNVYNRFKKNLRDAFTIEKSRTNQSDDVHLVNICASSL